MSTPEEKPPFPPGRLVARAYLLVAAGLGLAALVAAVLRAKPDWFAALLGSPAAWVVALGWIVLSWVLGNGWRPARLAVAAAVLLALVLCSSVMLAGAFWAFTRVSAARALLAAAAVFVAASAAGAVTGFDLRRARRVLGPLSTIVALVFGGYGHAPGGGGIFAWLESALAVLLAVTAVATTAQELHDAGRVATRGELPLRAVQFAAAAYFELVDLSVIAVLALGRKKRRPRGGGGAGAIE